MKKYRVTEQEMEKALRLTGEMIRAAEDGLTIAEDIARQLELRTGSEQADADAAAIEGGVTAFKQMQLTLQGKSLEEQVTAHLESALAPYEQSQRMGMLSCLLENVAQEAGVKVQHPDVYDETLYKQAVSQYITRYSVADMLGSTGWIGTMLDGKAVAKVSALNKSLEQGQYLAAALYILQRRGELGQVPDSVSPYELGVTAAAAIATGKELCLAALGKVNWKFVAKALSLIAVAACLCILVLGGYYLIPEIFLGVEAFFAQILTKLGLVGSLTSTIFGLISAAGFAWLLIYCGYDLCEATCAEENCQYVAEQMKQWHDKTLVPGAQALLAKLGAPVAVPKTVTAAAAEESADAPA